MSLKVVFESSDSEKHSSNVSSVAFNGNHVYTGSDDGTLKVWSRDLKLLKESDLNKGGILSIAVASTSEAIYTCTADQEINAWDKNSLQNLGIINSSLNVPQKLFFEQNQGILWAGDATGSVSKYEDKKETGKYELSEEVWDLLVTAPPTLIYTARDRDIAITEIVEGPLRTNAVLRGTLEGRSPVVVTGDYLCCLSRDGLSVQIHENNATNKFKLLREFRVSGMILNALCVEGDIIHVGGYSAEIYRFNVKAGSVEASIGVGACVNAMAPAAGGVYAALSDGRVLLACSS